MAEPMLTALTSRAVTTLTPWLLKALARRQEDRQREAIRWLLDPSRLADTLSVVSVDWPASTEPAVVRRFLRSPEAAAVVQELLTFRLAAQAGERPAQIRDTWLLTGTAAFGGPVDATITRFLDQAFEAIDAQCRIVADDVRRVYPKLAIDIREQAALRRMTNILEAIDRHNRTLSAAPHPRMAERALQQYRRQVVQAHGTIEPPDFETRRQVPIDDLYVSPRFLSADHHPITLPQLESVIDRTVLLGAPGAGKSTAAQVLVHRAASKIHRLVPFIVVLREFAAHQQEQSIVEHLEQRARTYYQCDLSASLIESLLLAGRAIVIFDGLDELIDTNMRRQVSDVVRLFCERFPLAPTLITSRIVGYDQAPMNPAVFSTVRISEFADKEVEEYVEKWFAQQTKLTVAERHRLATAFIDESRISPDLRRNPLMLALLCILYRGEKYIPRNRPAVYEKCANLLFEQWDSSRQIYVELRAGHAVDPAIKHLAFWMFTEASAQDGVPERVLVAETAKYLQIRMFDDERKAEMAAREFVDFCRGRAWVFSDAGTDADGERLYKFTHRTFMEYFAAYSITRTTDTPEAAAELLRPHIAREEWDVVGQLVAQILDRHTDGGGDRLITALLDHRPSRLTWRFACRCLGLVPMSPNLVRRIVDAVVEPVFTAGYRRGGGALAGAVLDAYTGPNSQAIEGHLIDRLDAAISASDIETCRLAINFIVYERYAIRAFKPVGDYWHTPLMPVLDRHRDRVRGVIAGHDGLRIVVFAMGQATIADVVSDGHAAFFRRAKSLVGNVVIHAPIWHILFPLIPGGCGGSTEARRRHAADLAAEVVRFGRPWPVDMPIPSPPLADRFDIIVEAEALTHRERLGVAVALCMLAELQPEYIASRLQSYKAGSLVADLAPFVIQRQTGRAGQLAAPERMEHGDLVLDWARHRRSFLDIRPSSRA